MTTKRERAREARRTATLARFGESMREKTRARGLLEGITLALNTSHPNWVVLRAEPLAQEAKDYERQWERLREWLRAWRRKSTRFLPGALQWTCSSTLVPGKRVVAARARPRWKVGRRPVRRVKKGW